MKYKGQDHLYGNKLQMLITSRKMDENEKTRDIYKVLSTGGRGKGKTRFIINSIMYYQSKYGDKDIPSMTELKFQVKCFNSVKHRYGLKCEEDFIRFISELDREKLKEQLPENAPVHMLLTFKKDNETELFVHNMLEQMSMTSRILFIEKAIRAYITDENIVNSNYYMALVNKEVINLQDYYNKTKDVDCLCDIWALMDKTDELKVLCKAVEDETVEPDTYKPKSTAQDIDALLMK